jgi:hypothetical protein
MGFLTPKPPKVPPPPTPANTPTSPLVPSGSIDSNLDFGASPSSLISTSPSGLKRKAQINKISLIGG